MNIYYSVMLLLSLLLLLWQKCYESDGWLRGRVPITTQRSCNFSFPIREGKEEEEGASNLYQGRNNNGSNKALLALLNQLFHLFRTKHAALLLYVHQA